MRLAYFILAHKNAEQIIRLVHRLQNSDTYFFIHLDRRAPATVLDILERAFINRSDVVFTRRHSCYWGNFGIVLGTLECIYSSLDRNICFDYGILLSGQDYPLQSNAHIHAYFERHGGAEFIESFPMDMPNRWTNMPGVFRALRRVQWMTFFVRSRRLYLPLRRTLPYGFRAYGGSQWWALTRSCLAYIRATHDSHPQLLRFFKHTFIPDECYFQTIISNSPFAKNICNNDLHYIDWDRPNPNKPRTFESADLVYLQQAKQLFARKFDPALDAAIMDHLDARSSVAASTQHHSAEGGMVQHSQARDAHMKSA
ncbi:beta-1,6-N-acetylglucosaminyltransferase [Noviherbaspirillum malthae]|uniref:beta-1,6-N-acetylglucosaminyltransferase n=1 Tax=Noviherbaspirillum malthae TaxID=1260987 RepID=UPI00188E2135|nr:beta-1,6-N-acetylglucosaminyltransferase [Noviherbaspirillum malthae]